MQSPKLLDDIETRQKLLISLLNIMREILQNTQRNLTGIDYSKLNDAFAQFKKNYIQNLTLAFDVDPEFAQFVMSSDSVDGLLQKESQRLAEHQRQLQKRKSAWMNIYDLATQIRDADAKSMCGNLRAQAANASETKANGTAPDQKAAIAPNPLQQIIIFAPYESIEISIDFTVGVILDLLRRYENALIPYEMANSYVQFFVNSSEVLKKIALLRYPAEFHLDQSDIVRIEKVPMMVSSMTHRQAAAFLSQMSSTDAKAEQEKQDAIAKILSQAPEDAPANPKKKKKRHKPKSAANPASPESKAAEQPKKSEDPKKPETVKKPNRDKTQKKQQQQPTPKKPKKSAADLKAEREWELRLAKKREEEAADARKKAEKKAAEDQLELKRQRAEEQRQFQLRKEWAEEKRRQAQEAANKNTMAEAARLEKEKQNKIAVQPAVLPKPEDRKDKKNDKLADDAKLQRPSSVSHDPIKLLNLFLGKAENHPRFHCHPEGQKEFQIYLEADQKDNEQEKLERAGITFTPIAMPAGIPGGLNLSYNCIIDFTPEILQKLKKKPGEEKAPLKNPAAKDENSKPSVAGHFGKEAFPILPMLPATRYTGDSPANQAEEEDRGFGFYGS